MFAITVTTVCIYMIILDKILLGLQLFTYYDEIMGDMSNKSDQYSMTTHPKNKCFANQDRLAFVITKDPVLSARFLTYESGHPDCF
jgi:hypothetical protein